MAGMGAGGLKLRVFSSEVSLLLPTLALSTVDKSSHLCHFMPVLSLSFASLSTSSSCLSNFLYFTSLCPTALLSFSVFT